jgi:ADP-ribose pyrophosphatase
MKITGSTLVAKVKFAALFAVSYLDRRGNAKQWYLVTRADQPKCVTGRIHHPDAAIIVPYHRDEQKLAVIREFRIPVGDFQYGFPAGLLDPGEDLAIAAARELFEETGLKLETIYRYSPAVFSSAGITDESIAMVFAEVSGRPHTANNEASEEIDIFLMDRLEIQALLNRDDIVFGARAWLVMDTFVRMGTAYFN